MAKGLYNLGYGYEALGSAVVMQAVMDWRNAVKTLRRQPYNMEAIVMQSEVEEFLCSSRFKKFTRLNGKELLKQLEIEAGLRVA